MDRTGQTLLGKYELTRLLGKGGMGAVWEGEHTLTGRRVAVKILSDAYLANKKVVARFGREARAASAVQHEGIVEILDQDRTAEGVPFLVMEYLEGESLGQRLKRRRKLSEDETLAIVLPLLDALYAAHEAGVIHRDLKPDNVFILPDLRGEERVKILDFGISQKADEIQHNLTQEGSVLGTPHYMSPEQARGEAGIDARVDIYAVGVMFFECVVGDVPFDAKNYNALLQTILSTPPPSPRSKGAEIGPAVEQLILAAMDKRRELRPPTARVFHELLLEAGMQEEDALLDTKAWIFVTPSAPPPPITFSLEDMEEMPASEVMDGGASEPPAAVPPFPPRQVAATSAFGDLPDLEADIFNQPARGARHAGANGAAARPLAREMQPVRHPAGPSPASTARPAPIDPMMRHPRAPDAATGPAQQAPVGLNSPPWGTHERPKRPSGSRPALTRPDGGSPGWLRVVFNWLLVVAALTALIYLANVVFKRPDPRKQRRAKEEAAQDVRASDRAGGQPLPR